MLYKIVSDAETTNTLIISPAFQTKFFFRKRHSVTVHAGLKKLKLRVRVEQNQDIELVMISADALAELSIPGNLRYQVCKESQGIRLGPVLGLLLSKAHEKLDDEFVTYLQNYTATYPQTHGLLYAFSMEGINFEANTAEGYYYNPNNKSGPWLPAVLPLPDAIFRRTLLNDVQVLAEITNNRFFNSYRISKWDYWRYTAKNESLRKHMPVTRKFSSSTVLSQMLDQFDAVVLKLSLGSQGYGLIMIRKTGAHYSVQRKWDKKPRVFTDRTKMLSYIRRITRNRRYLVQQAIDLLRFEGRLADFRVIMQKDFTRQWKCTGIITSMGAVKGICSNYPAKDSIFLSFEDFCSRYLGLSPAAIAEKKQEVIATCINACEVLDRPGLHFGDVGIDLAMDTSLHPWIMEVNTLHMEDLLLYIGDEAAFNALHANRIQYLTALSGFQMLESENKGSLI
ncbi:MAG: YheC/YheD family protein [Syntrophomonadales bacterium]